MLFWMVSLWVHLTAVHTDLLPYINQDPRRHKSSIGYKESTELNFVKPVTVLHKTKNIPSHTEISTLLICFKISRLQL